MYGITEEKTLIRRFFGNLDWMLLGAIVCSILLGFIGVYSATLHYENPVKFLVTQSIAVIGGATGFALLLGVNYQFYNQFRSFIYAASLFILGLVLVAGTTVNGTKGWFRFGSLSFQPVELAKLMFILVLAGYLDSRWRETRRLSTLVGALLLLFGHLGLIMMQPDFSSTLSYFPVLLMMLFVAGVEPMYLLGIMLYGALAAGIPLMATFFNLQPALLKAHPFLDYLVTATHGGLPALAVVGSVIAAVFLVWWLLVKFRIRVPLIYPLVLSLIIAAGSVSSAVVNKSLKEYQRKRLIVFLKPDIDPFGSGYNIIQARIAIGSGQMTGKGLFSGTQTQLGFIPEQHTDFIFAVIGEEAGYVVSQLAVLVYFVIIWRSMVVAREARDRYGSLVATGIATMFAFYAIINIGMVMGLMPATGLPLPLYSYGGSSMVSSLWAMGLLFSIHIRRFTH